MDANPRLFTLIRKIDESGISGVGRVLDGVVFHTGQVVTCWRTDLNAKDKEGYSALGVYPSFDAFLHVHVNPHSQDANEVIFFTAVPEKLD